MGKHFGITHSLGTFLFKALLITLLNFSNISWQNRRLRDFSSDLTFDSSLPASMLNSKPFCWFLPMAGCEATTPMSPHYAVHSVSLLDIGFEHERLTPLWPTSQKRPGNSFLTGGPPRKVVWNIFREKIRKYISKDKRRRTWYNTISRMFF